MLINYQAYFERKYPHLTSEDIQMLEGQAKEILIHSLFKSHYKVDEKQREYAYQEYQYWVLRCMQEMVERLGITSAIAYKENGISINFSREQVSKALIEELVPITYIRSR